MKRTIFTLAAFFICVVTIAQSRDSTRQGFPTRKGFICQFTYTYQFPGGDFANRFSNNSALGAGVYYKTHSNLIFGIEGNYLFGGKIRETGIFDAITDEYGYAVDMQGNLVEVKGQMRGMNFMAKIGKIFPFKGRNQNSGIMFSVGAGYLEHWIRLDNSTQNIAALQGDMKYGYDRLTGGYAFNQFLGYQNLDRKKRINFFIGVELYQGFTKSIRTYDYDLRSSNTSSRLDLMYGLRFGWLLPIYSNSNADNDYIFH